MNAGGRQAAPGRSMARYEQCKKAVGLAIRVAGVPAAMDGT
jgi:hypothetical protein